jgi:hypothetical protein
MKLLLKLSWRNLWRNKRRLFLTLLAIAFAAFATIAMRGLQLGTYAVNIKHVVSSAKSNLSIDRGAQIIYGSERSEYWYYPVSVYSMIKYYY